MSNNIVKTIYEEGLLKRFFNIVRCSGWILYFKHSLSRNPMIIFSSVSHRLFVNRQLSWNVIRFRHFIFTKSHDFVLSTKTKYKVRKIETGIKKFNSWALNRTDDPFSGVYGAIQMSDERAVQGTRPPWKSYLRFEPSARGLSYCRQTMADVPRGFRLCFCSSESFCNGRSCRLVVVVVFEGSLRSV